jgi:hypothetical protein
MTSQIDDRSLLHLPWRVRVRAALRTVAECLALQVPAPASSPPDWSCFDWRTASAVAAMHGITGILAARLRWGARFRTCAQPLCGAAEC